MSQTHEVDRLVGHLFRQEYGKMVAVLASAFGLGRLGVAEELVQETLVTAMHHWSMHGVPDNPSAWLMRVAKNKALNWLKRSSVERRVLGQLDTGSSTSEPAVAFLESDVEDSTLRMMFACCHPLIAESDQLALTLKVLGGFGSREIATALLIRTETVDKRIYRAKNRIRSHPIELEVPGGAELRARLLTVCRCLYLLFNEGYLATRGEEPIRRDLCDEAQRLVSLLATRFPTSRSVHALRALMCFHAARFESRIDETGSLVLFAEQDRSRWDLAMIRRGLAALSQSAGGDELSAYHLEASIAAQHCIAPSFAETNWPFILRLYRHLLRVRPNPVVRLNIAIVIGQVEGADAALEQLDALLDDRSLARYALLHAAIAEFAYESGDVDRAHGALERALSLTTSSKVRLTLEKKRARLIH